MAAKRAKEQCFYCPEKFVPGHKCASKGVFLLEMEDDANVASWAEEFGISLHVLTEIGTSSTMRLNVQIGCETFVALVDSGSTHTFIHTDAANHLGLHVTPRPSLSIKVANGDRVSSDGICPRTLLPIGDESFVVDLYSLPLTGFDLILTRKHFENWKKT